MTTQVEVHGREAAGRHPLGVRIVAWGPTLIASAALFSLLFAGDASLKWLGTLGFVPLGLRLAGCPSCGTGRRSPSASSWPGH